MSRNSNNPSIKEWMTEKESRVKSRFSEKINKQDGQALIQTNQRQEKTQTMQIQMKRDIKTAERSRGLLRHTMKTYSLLNFKL